MQLVESEAAGVRRCSRPDCVVATHVLAEQRVANLISDMSAPPPAARRHVVDNEKVKVMRLALRGQAVGGG